MAEEQVIHGAAVCAACGGHGKSRLAKGAGSVGACCGRFAAGGAGYGLLEMVWRGYTHISMIVVGGLCLLLLDRLARCRRPVALLAVAGGACITAVEFVAGCVVNLWLGLEVWDYSEELYHLWGQVCPRFTVLWSLLCLALIPLCRLAGRMRTLLGRRGPRL